MLSLLFGVEGQVLEGLKFGGSCSLGGGGRVVGGKEEGICECLQLFKLEPLMFGVFHV